ncbi:hypothetical protein bcgnr5372_38780 [Bacillus luti]|nr:hypothetical protein [Bacillus cereus]HDR8330711.1 hypothetical protein [Bacillus cereus]HDR8336448.1 hypothetical protein [Bacillus cereus]
MAWNTRFNIQPETGNFIVTSEDGIIELSPRYKVLERHKFQTVWSFANELIEFTMDGHDAKLLLEAAEAPLHNLAVQVKNHHFSVMKYERV